MELAKHVSIRVFIKNEDNKEEVLNTLKNLTALSDEDFNKLLKTTTAMGFEKPLIIASIDLKKNKHKSLFMNKLFSSLSNEDKLLLRKDLHLRIDEYCHFFIRLDKDLLLRDIYSITNGGNCFHIEIALPIYPCKYDKAKEFLLSFL